jgi:drug/metabolite transporter (DMT)-like permease
VLIAVVAALLAGCSFAVGSVLQQSAAREAPTDESLSWRLLVDLAHRKRWLVGIGSDAVSFALQALALAFGPIALVQPLAVTGLLFAIPLAVRWRGRRLGPSEWTGTVAVAGGLALFLVAASPSEGHPQTTVARWLLILVGVGALMALGVGAGLVAHGPIRPTFYAVGAGAAFGLLAALTKTSTWLLGQGAVAFFTSWQPYAMAVVAVLGAIVQQSAFQAGPLPASVPVMDAMEPAVAVSIGVFAFGEQVGSSVAALGMEAVGIAALLAGIVMLDRSPVVAELHRTGGEPDVPDRRIAGGDQGSRAGWTRIFPFISDTVPGVGQEPTERPSGAGVADGAQ